MKVIAAAVSALALMSTAALAADLTAPAIPPTFEATATDWSGFYVGINAGMGGGTFEHPFSYSSGGTSLTGSADLTANGFVGGVQAGHNWQIGDKLLFGLEADVQTSDVDGRLSLSASGGGTTLDVDAGTHLDYFATIRPRLGMAMGNFVVYGTAGLALGHSTSSANLSITGTGGDVSVENDRSGYTVGAGVEVALTDKITAKAEYLYTNLGTESLYDGPLLGGDNATLDSTIAFSTVRAGLNLHF